MKYKTSDLGLTFEVNQYEIPRVQLFVSQEEAFPASYKEVGWYNVSALLEFISSKYFIDIGRSLSSYVRSKKGDILVKEGFFILKKGLHLSLETLGSIPTEAPEYEYHHGGEDKEEEIDNSCLKVRLEILYNPLLFAISEIEEIIQELRNYRAVQHTKNKIHIICSEDGELSLQPFEIKVTELDLERNYGKEFVELHDYILKKLSATDSGKGMALFYGQPGCGKTYYIRHLINNISNKKLIYIPPNLAESIAEPKFVTFLMNHPGSILVIEDGENILKSRKLSHNSSIANLLNLADGLLSDCLNIQVICTFNCDIGQIDSALLRKGRLIAKHEFKALDVKAAQCLSDALGFKSTINKSMTLTEIYNQADLGFGEDKPEKIGFR